LSGSEPGTIRIEIVARASGMNTFEDAAMLVVLVDLTSWGWTLLLFGLAMLAVGGGLLMGQTWARVTAVVIVGLHAVLQVVVLGAYPTWALLVLALDTAVIFALTARWPDASYR
jgi:hypothetical protein